MRSIIFSFAFLGLILFSCSKSPETIDSSPETINLSSENNFYSSELVKLLGMDPTSPDKNILEERGYKHYLVLYRNKEFLYQDDWFRKFVYGETSSQNDLSLSIGQTKISSAKDDHFVSYIFSNKLQQISINGIQTDQLLENDFNEIPFEFTINKMTYQGNFPEPITLENNNIEDQINSISHSKGKNISWNPSKENNGIISIYIYHMSTTSGSDLLSPKVYTANDIGTFNITSEMLSNYLVGDEISIHLSRSIFKESTKLLVRSVEEQNWGPIELLN